MKADEVEELFTRLEYERDVRWPPDGRRRGRFRVGWGDATERGEVYATDTLEQLTWHNLGYRFGKHFGYRPPEQVNQAFELLAESYEPSGPGSNQVSAAAPSSQQYVAAFRRIGSLTDGQIQMLRTHYYAPDRTITATEMAHAVGHEHYSFANSQYGRLGRLVGEQLDYNPMQERLGTLVTFDKRQGEWNWLMRPEVAQALEQLGWVEAPVPFPGETQAQENSTRGKTLYSIVSEVNLRAKEHPIGELQEVRKDLKGKRKLQQDIFRLEDPKTTSEEWAFHYGGRTELQFNIGFERVNGIDELRHGVAFSLQTNQTLPKIDVLVPKVKLFNDFIRLYSEKYTDMRMWHYREERSFDYMPTSIPSELITEGVFVFLGKRQPVEYLDYELLLDDLDRLLPLYKYVESGGTLQPVSAARAAPFAFRSGCTVKRSATVASQAQRELDVSLKHNDLQEALYRRLADEYGVENVGTELSSGVGTSVDVVVRQEDGFWFYEIKTLHSPRACLRQALGQLLEYAFWPGSQEATRLVIVGETALDEEGTEYLHALTERFSLPLEYEQISV